MKNYSFEISESNNDQLDKYLNKELINYGIAEAKGNRPKYIYCSINDANNHIIGGIKGYAMLNMFYISQLFVNEKHRGIGLGKKLLSEIEVVAKKHNCKIIRLDTLNRKSHDFYEKSGFEKTITIHEYMNGFDLLFFHKNINKNL